nr:snake venom metalloproteinases P-III precursor [Malpolon monspessulanus]
MIRSLLVIVFIVLFPYQGSSVIVESGNENGYEVEYPEEVAALRKGGIPDAQPETKYEDTMQHEFQLNGEPLRGSGVCNSRGCMPVPGWRPKPKN